tara:strand:- start:289 stop:1341 length:1053 start_codon:yes stop_codon:yes gene_type:complete
MKKIKFGKKFIGGKKCFVVAEVSANHCQSLDKAFKLIEIAKKSGADAVKFQTYKPSSLALKVRENQFKSSVKNSPWKKFKDRYSLFEKAYFPWEWHKDIFNKAKKIGIDIFSSPFDLEAVDLLEKLKCPGYKIASSEITDISLLKKVARTKKPVIVSLGLAELKDINLSVKTLRKNGCKELVLLKCQAHYPAEPENLNLLSLKLLSKKFNCHVGFSDHTLGMGSSISAVALGGKLIEKHIKLENEKKSVDAFFSMGPKDFKKMVNEIRIAEKAVGVKTFKIDKKTKKALSGRRSLFASKDIKKGEIINKDNIKSVRPFTGLHPKYLEKVLGKKAKKSLPYGKPLKLGDFN